MRQFVIDDLTREEMENLENYMKSTIDVGAMDGMFWLNVPEDLEGEAQEGHEDCRPFCFAFELTRDRMIMELLVRSRNNMHCTCIAYATTAQRDFALGFLDTMIAEKQIKA